jgi:hypothetical protein
MNPQGKNLHVVFLPWHSGEIPYRWLYDRIVRKGDAVVAYYFAEEVLAEDAEAVVKTYHHVQEIIAQNLAKITAEHRYRSVHFISISLGNVALAVVSSKFEKFDSATLICTASSLAKSVWYGDRTKDTRAGFEVNGLTVSQLETAWQTVEPINYIEALAHKKVVIILSKTDICIPIKFQWEYVKAARSVVPNLRIKTTRLGHYGAIIKYCLIGKLTA